MSMLQVAVTFGRMKGILYPILLSQTVVFNYTFNPPYQPSFEKKIPLL
jgi:hypothetical protein